MSVSPLPLFLHLRQHRHRDTRHVKETEQTAMMAPKFDVGSILPNFSRFMFAMGFEGSGLPAADLALLGTAG